MRKEKRTPLYPPDPYAASAPDPPLVAAPISHAELTRIYYSQLVVLRTERNAWSAARAPGASLDELGLWQAADKLKQTYAEVFSFGYELLRQQKGAAAA